MLVDSKVKHLAVLQSGSNQFKQSLVDRLVKSAFIPVNASLDWRTFFQTCNVSNLSMHAKPGLRVPIEVMISVPAR
jgi:hypothetical protein